MKRGVSEMKPPRFETQAACETHINLIEAELKWWHNLIRKHHNNKTCPDLKTYVENLQTENADLKDLLLTRDSYIEALEADLNDFQSKAGWKGVSGE